MWALALCRGLSRWKERLSGGKVGRALKSSFWEAPPQTRVSSSRDGGTYEKMTRKTSLGWKEQSPRGRMRDLALAWRAFWQVQPQPCGSFPARGREHGLCREGNSAKATWRERAATAEGGLKHLLALAVQNATEAAAALRMEPSESLRRQQQQFGNHRLAERDVSRSSVKFWSRFSPRWSRLPAKH